MSLIAETFEISSSRVILLRYTRYQTWTQVTVILFNAKMSRHRN